MHDCYIGSSKIGICKIWQMLTALGVLIACIDYWMISSLNLFCSWVFLTLFRIVKVAVFFFFPCLSTGCYAVYCGLTSSIVVILLETDLWIMHKFFLILKYADICQLGMGQRTVNVLAREYCDDIKRKNKPIILSHRILLIPFHPLYIEVVYCFLTDSGVICRHVTWSTARAREDVKKWPVIIHFHGRWGGKLLRGLLNLSPLQRWSLIAISSCTLFWT